MSLNSESLAQAANRLRTARRLVVFTQFERHLDTSVVTQNVDSLHQEAGSVRVREVHGSFFRVVTLGGRPVRRLVRDDLRAGVLRLPRLMRAVAPLIDPSWRGIKRPGLVLFGDAMAQPDWGWAQRQIRMAKGMEVAVGVPAVMVRKMARFRNPVREGHEYFQPMRAKSARAA